MALFARARFMLRFWKAYRAARKSGVTHEEALAQTQAELIDAEFGDGTFERIQPTPLDVPEDVEDYLRDPSSHDDTSTDTGTITITAEDIALIRQSRWVWDGAERGAPMLAPESPFGKPDALSQIGTAFEIESPMQQAKRFVSMYRVLNMFTLHGTLSPGTYSLRNVDAEHLRNQMTGYGGEAGVSDAEIGLTDDGRFKMTNDHIKLLRALEIDWSNEWDNEERLACGEFPAPACDPKRPYGDMTFIELDMAHILGEIPLTADGSNWEPDPKLAARLQQLHWQMLGAMQVFVENAELEPGTHD